jgi:hypothetical protein
MKLLPDGSFAKRLRKAIGEELDYRLRDYPDEREIEFSRSFPVEALYMWIVQDGGLDPEWLGTDDGQFLDDEGDLLPTAVKPSLSGVEQLAAYGLYLIDVGLGICGPSTESDWDENRVNPYGWKESDVINHKAECLLLAYQALSYTHKLLSKAPLDSAEKAKSAQLDFSTLGKAGAAKRHASMAALREWGTAQYRSKTWQSANQAAHELKESIVKHGRSIGAHLTEQNAQRTIAEWFRKSV